MDLRFKLIESSKPSFSSYIFGRFCGVAGRSWAENSILGSLASLSGVQAGRKNRSWAVLKASWAVLGRLGGILESLGVLLGYHLEMSWRLLGGVLEAFEGVLEAMLGLDEPR